jgi:hypothetical protein
MSHITRPDHDVADVKELKELEKLEAGEPLPLSEIDPESFPTGIVPVALATSALQRSLSSASGSGREG